MTGLIRGYELCSRITMHGLAFLGYIGSVGGTRVERSGASGLEEGKNAYYVDTQYLCNDTLPCLRYTISNP